MRRFLTFLAYFLFFLLVGLFLAGFAARYVHPRYMWWIQLVAVFLPYLSALVFLAGVPILIARKWILMSITAILWLLVAVRFFPEGGRLDPSSVGMGQRLTVMTLNSPTWYPDERGIRARTFRGLVDRYRPDLISLQETWVNFNAGGRLRNMRKDVSVLTDSSAYTTVGQRGSGAMTSYVPVFGLLPPEQVNFFLLAPDENGQGGEVARVEYTWRRRKVVVYNVHLQTFGSEKPWHEDNESLLNPRVWAAYFRQYRSAVTRRAGQAEQVAQMIREESDPVIITGDFNSTRHNWDYGWISDGFSDAFTIAGNGWGATYHARYPFARIDFILVSSELGVVSAEVPKVILSDHRPVVATLSWREDP